MVVGPDLGHSPETTKDPVAILDLWGATFRLGRSGREQGQHVKGLALQARLFSFFFFFFNSPFLKM